MARVNERSHSFICRPHVYPQVEWTMPALNLGTHCPCSRPVDTCGHGPWTRLVCAELHSPATERHRTLVGAHFRPADGRRLSWPDSVWWSLNVLKPLCKNKIQTASLVGRRLIIHSPEVMCQPLFFSAVSEPRDCTFNVIRGHVSWTSFTALGRHCRRPCPGFHRLSLSTVIRLKTNLNLTACHKSKCEICPPMCENMTSSAKPEIDNVLYFRQWRTEPQQQVICKENIVKFGHSILIGAEGVYYGLDMRILRYASWQTDRQTRWSQYFAPLPGGEVTMFCAFMCFLLLPPPSRDM